MDAEIVRKLDDVVLARAGVLGKRPDAWSEEDARRVGMELDRMPGEYRVIKDWRGAARDKWNRENAASHGLDAETAIRITVTGNDGHELRFGHPESPLRGPNSGIPDSTYGVEISDAMITPS